MCNCIVQKVSHQVSYADEGSDVNKATTLKANAKTSKATNLKAKAAILMLTPLAKKA